MRGFRTLFYKEVLRFWKVATQTLTAPIVTAMLYLLIFGHVLEGRLEVYPGVSYTAFLVPGLVMMSVLQNAFANSSSSLIQSKITGNLVFVLLTPLSHWEMFSAYVLAGMLRGLMVGFGEARMELAQVMDDLRIADVDFLTIGQYLQPTVKHAAVAEFITPDAFADYAALARAKGFLLVSATPLTRSSYHADSDFAALRAARATVVA